MIVKKPDYEYLKNVPIKDVLSSVGARISKKKTFCINPDCTDSHSKHPSAHIYESSNKIHCFCCGQGFNPIQVIQFKMGYPNTKDGYRDAAIALGEEFGFGGINTFDTTTTKKVVKTPEQMYVKTFSNIPIEYLNSIGLTENPFKPQLIRIKKNTETYGITLKESVLLVKEKIKVAINTCSKEIKQAEKNIEMIEKHPQNYLARCYLTAKTTETADKFYGLLNEYPSENTSEFLSHMKTIYEDTVTFNKKMITNHHNPMLFNINKANMYLDRLLEFKVDTYKSLQNRGVTSDMISDEIEQQEQDDVSYDR